MTTEVQKPNSTIIWSWAHKGVRLQDPTHTASAVTWYWIRPANDFIIHLNQTVILKTAASSSSESIGNFIILHVIRDVITNVKIKVKVTLGRPWRQEWQ